MKILVANLGSTSFKYRLFDLESESQLARGSIDRIGQPVSECIVEIDDHRQETQRRIDDHAQAAGATHAGQPPLMDNATWDMVIAT